MGKPKVLAAFCLVALAAIVCVPAQANLIVNGSFEEPLVVPVGEGSLFAYQHLNGSELTGWESFSTFNGTVLFTSAYSPVSDGIQAVQLEAPGDSISQTFDTTIGQAYLLSFDLSAHFSGLGLSTLGVNIGAASGTFSGSYLNYVTDTLQFTADAATTTLTFTNLGPFLLTYSHLDNVSVVAVCSPFPGGGHTEGCFPGPGPFPAPAPGTLALIGLALAGMAAMRRRAIPIRR
jgi:hypothetical protein